MFIKLGIIVSIVVLGGMVFSNEINNIFPTTSTTVLDSLNDDVTSFSSKTLNSVEQRIDESIDKIADKTSNSITNEISDVGDKITNKIDESKESSQKVINKEILNFNLIEFVQNIYI